MHELCQEFRRFRVRRISKLAAKAAVRGRVNCCYDTNCNDVLITKCSMHLVYMDGHGISMHSIIIVLIGVGVVPGIIDVLGCDREFIIFFNTINSKSYWYPSWSWSVALHHNNQGSTAAFLASIKTMQDWWERTASNYSRYVTCCYLGSPSCMTILR